MRWIFAIVLSWVLVSLGICADELYLSGYVVSYDKSTGILAVNVGTPGCEGIRQFYLRDESHVSSLQIGKRIHFYINSSQCETGKIHEMFFRRK